METGNIITLSEDIVAVIDRRLADSGTTRSEFVEKLLRKYLIRDDGSASEPAEKNGSCQENRRLLEAVNAACYEPEPEEQHLRQKMRCYHRRLIKDNEPW
jgi:hypothetical protein